MDADARQLALEARVAVLEIRLRRLEAVQSGTAYARSGPSPAPAAGPARAPAPVSPAAPRSPTPVPPTPAAASPATASPAPVPVSPAPVSPAPVPATLETSQTNVPNPLAPIDGEPESVRANRAGAPQAPTASGPHVSVAGGLAAPPPLRPGVSLADLEARLTGRALAWVGGLALVLGSIFFLSLAFSRGWIGPEGRVIIGLLAGAASLAAGAWFMERRNRLLGHVLTPVGLAIISISLVGATRLYGLIPVELGLLLALASSIAAAVIAVRADSRIVAAFGLIAVLAAPPLLRAPADMTTLAFVAVVLIGTTGVALWRSWNWLPAVAFVLAAPQVAVWITDDPAPLQALVALGGFWLINLVAAAGEEMRRHRDDLSASSATLMLANVAFLLWAGFVVLDADLTTYRGLFLVLIAIAHLAIGGAFVRRDGDADLFGLLTIGTGLAALAMAAPVHFGASAIPIAWTAEAVALTWVAARRGHPYSMAVAGALFLLAGGYVVSSLMPLYTLGDEALPRGFVGSLVFFIAGTGVGLWFLRDLGLRCVAAAYALFVVVLCALLRLDDVPLALAMTAALVVAAALPSIFELLPDRPIDWRTNGLIPADLRSIAWRSAARWVLPEILVLTGALATVAVARLYGPGMATAPARLPFIDAAGACLAIYLGALALAAGFQKDERYREPVAALGLTVVAWAFGRTFDGVALVVAWSALFLAGVMLWRGLRSIATGPRHRLGGSFGVTLMADGLLPLGAVFVAGLAALHLAAFDLPILDLGEAVIPAVPFTDAGTLGAASLALSILVAAAVVGTREVRRASIIAVGALFLYLVPFEVAPWAVVVLWAGSAALATLLSRRDHDARNLYLGAALGIACAAATIALTWVAPPSRLVVGRVAVDGAMALQTLVALSAMTATSVAIALTARPSWWARWVGIVAGTTFVYLASVLLVDLIAIQVGGSMSVAELRTWGQVGLSVLWAILGLIAFVGGLQRRFPELRHAGLVLLGLATTKVFLFDLSALDVAYRVISLIALGLLLLVGAGLWQRNQPGRDGTAPPA